MIRWISMGLLAGALIAPPAVWADPCGMVPPIWTGSGPPLARSGVQRTYVFFRDGLESLVLRPGFEGRVEEFGMLIPFPSPPAIRKVPEEVFAHVAAAIDPPEVVVDLRPRAARAVFALGYGRADGPPAREESLEIRRDQVAVLSEEAVGMYEVAVLAAGGAQALARWMEDHGFRYPRGMDAVCEDYVAAGWCFVAVKARVGARASVDPRPGMRRVDPGLPAGAGFSGHVQAMGFRFWSDELVVPMRLSAFNPGELHNVVYVLAQGGRRIAHLPASDVVRQVPGWRLRRNISDPLPLRILGGRLEDVPKWRRESLAAERDPNPANGIARELFASDLLAARQKTLAHAFEEEEKRLLAVGFELGLGGPEIEELVRDELATQRERALTGALADLDGMTLTVMEGEFDRAVLAAENLTFPRYTIDAERNSPRRWDAKYDGAPPSAGGTLGAFPRVPRPGGPAAAGLAALAVLGALAFAARKRPRAARVALLVLLAAVPATGQRSARARPAAWPSARSAPHGAGARPDPEAGAAARPAAESKPAPVRCAFGLDEGSLLAERARRGGSAAPRGEAIVRLVELGGPRARSVLAELAAKDPSPLVRTWSAGGLVRLARTPTELEQLSGWAQAMPALARPLAERWRRELARAFGPVLPGEPSGGATGGRETLARALAAAANAPRLSQELLPVLSEVAPRDLTAVLVGGATDPARRLAAALLATAAAQGQAGVATAVGQALAFDPGAARVPWAGGALFLPQLPWSRAGARALVSDLVAWMIFCDARGLEQDETRAGNALSSVGLLGAAGIETPRGDARDAATWLKALARSAGAERAHALLSRQGLAGDPRWMRALEGL